MTFALDDHWVWDFWIADDGDRFHLYYLHAPTSLGDERLRHRNARIGHAVSTDLHRWHDLGEVLRPRAAVEDGFDATAVWTGCVVPGPDGTWRMFYTGSRFLDAEGIANVESVGVATSRDLHDWHPAPEPVTVADPRWYEKLADGTWREEAWRDPWVFADPDGEGWHMLITARSRVGDGEDRGVIGHARSSDLDHWTVEPPLSASGTGFAHLEVPQVVTVDGHRVLLFSCSSDALVGRRAGETGGIWQVPAPEAGSAFHIDSAVLLTDERRYAGRVVHDREGRALLLAFENGVGADFSGRIADPVPVHWDDTRRRLVLSTEAHA